MNDVSAITKARLGQPVARGSSVEISEGGKKETERLLDNTLTPDTAVQIALLNNKRLQASLAELSIAEADLIQAGRIRNPGLSFNRLRGGDDIEIDRSVTFDLIGLLTISMRKDIEQRRFSQAKLLAASRAIRLAEDTRRAYFNAVATRQIADYMEQVKDAAEASAELAQRMARAGNWSKLDQAREQAFHTEAIAMFARSRQNTVAARERLTILLGLSSHSGAFTLPDRLPELPPTPDEIANAESLAVDQRLDIQIAKQETEAMARSLGLTKRTGFINVLEAGYTNKSTTGQPRQNGYQVSFELPIFDWGDARAAKAEAFYMQSVHHAADVAIQAQSEVREAYSAYRTSYDIAKHYRDEVVPLRKKISEEVLLRYNGMLASVFELLADAREQVTSVNAAIEAQQDFWIADTNLKASMDGIRESTSGSVSGNVTGSIDDNASARRQSSHLSPSGAN